MNTFIATKESLRMGSGALCILFCELVQICGRPNFFLSSNFLMIFIFGSLEEPISVHTHCSDQPNQGEIVSDDRAKLLLALSLSCYYRK